MTPTAGPGRPPALGTQGTLFDEGATRGDARATLRLDAPLGDVMPALAARTRDRVFTAAEGGQG